MVDFAFFGVCFKRTPLKTPLRTLYGLLFLEQRFAWTEADAQTQMWPGHEMSTTPLRLNATLPRAAVKAWPITF